MNVAPKEWAVVVEALTQGKQDFLLRKGGIAEGKRGFELKHRRFLFVPTWEHQQQDWIRPAYQDLFQSLKPADPDVLTIRLGAQSLDVRPAPTDIAELLQSQEHIWAEPYLRMHYEYHPDLPLYRVQVSVFTLPEPGLDPQRPPLHGLPLLGRPLPRDRRLRRP